MCPPSKMQTLVEVETMRLKKRLAIEQTRITHIEASANKVAKSKIEKTLPKRVLGELIL